jgi:hypothetical protein
MADGRGVESVRLVLLAKLGVGVPVSLDVLGTTWPCTGLEQGTFLLPNAPTADEPNNLAPAVLDDSRGAVAYLERSEQMERKLGEFRGWWGVVMGDPEDPDH